jgi:hypothetical protein
MSPHDIGNEQLKLLVSRVELRGNARDLCLECIGSTSINQRACSLDPAMMVYRFLHLSDNRGVRSGADALLSWPHALMG